MSKNCKCHRAAVMWLDKDDIDDLFLDVVRHNGRKVNIENFKRVPVIERPKYNVLSGDYVAVNFCPFCGQRIAWDNEG